MARPGLWNRAEVEAVTVGADGGPAVTVCPDLKRIAIRLAAGPSFGGSRHGYWRGKARQTVQQILEKLIFAAPPPIPLLHN